MEREKANKIKKLLRMIEFCEDALNHLHSSLTPAKEIQVEMKISQIPAENLYWTHLSYQELEEMLQYWKDVKEQELDLL